MSETHPTRWRGVNATYSYDERQIQGQLKTKEQWFIHLLKAFTNGEIQSGREEAENAPDARIAQQAAGGAVEKPLNKAAVEVRPPLADRAYTNPEDIEFGKPKRRKRIYALVTTWRQSCQVPTKREGEFWVKVWKAWHERQGWKVTSHPSGYFATDPAGARVAISLHEYDRESHERLN